MKEPKAKPAGSGSIHFQPLLPRSVAIFHKFNFGYVDLQLRGMGKRINEARAIFGDQLDEDMRVEAAQSASIRRGGLQLRACI